MHKTLSVSNPFVMCSDGGLLNGASLSFVRQIVFASRGQYGPLMAEPACGDPHIQHFFSSERKTGSDGLLLEVAHSLGKHQSGEERSGVGSGSGSRSSLQGCVGDGPLVNPVSSTRGQGLERSRRGSEGVS